MLGRTEIICRITESHHRFLRGNDFELEWFGGRAVNCLRREVAGEVVPLGRREAVSAAGEKKSNNGRGCDFFFIS